MRVLYNEIEPFAAEWIQRLSLGGLIPTGYVDTRSVADLTSSDLKGIEQFHTFAGLGGWAHALSLAGWPSDFPVWTGSCPCQPFSAAGKRTGFDDARHLWPIWFNLIRECRPPIIFGEQVASPDGLVWLDAVSADLEAEGYAFGAADLCAAGVGAPHLRQRLFFVAYSDCSTRGQRRTHVLGSDPRGNAETRGGLGSAGSVGSVGDGHAGGLPEDRDTQSRVDIDGRGAAFGVGDADGNVAGGDSGAAPRSKKAIERSTTGRNADRASSDLAVAAGATRGFWYPAEWLPCRDGKYRPVEPGTFPLAHGVPGRVGMLRAYGNAIVPQVAATFIRAAAESLGIPLTRTEP